MRLIADQGNDHRVEVEEEHDKMETELDERFLLVDVEFSEDLSGIQKMCVVNDLLDIECHKWQIEDERNPVPVDEEQDSQEPMNRRFRNNVRVQTVAKVDRIDIVTLEITIHDSEEHL